MLPPRYILFQTARARATDDDVARALQAIPGISLRAEAGGWVVRDVHTGCEVAATRASGALIVADHAAIAAALPKSERDRSAVAAADARFELRAPSDGGPAVNLLLLVADALERLTRGLGFDTVTREVSHAADGAWNVVAGGAEEEEWNREMHRIAALSDEEVSREIRAEGGDPESGRQRTADLVAGLMKRNEVYYRLERARDDAATSSAPGREPRDALLAKLTAVRALPIVGDALGLVMRDRSVSSMSDGELQAIADELAALSQTPT